MTINFPDPNKQIAPSHERSQTGTLLVPSFVSSYSPLHISIRLNLIGADQKNEWSWKTGIIPPNHLPAWSPETSMIGISLLKLRGPKQIGTNSLRIKKQKFFRYKLSGCVEGGAGKLWEVVHDHEPRYFSNVSLNDSTLFLSVHYNLLFTEYTF